MPLTLQPPCRLEFACCRHMLMLLSFAIDATPYAAAAAAIAERRHFFELMPLRYFLMLTFSPLRRFVSLSAGIFIISAPRLMPPLERYQLRYFHAFSCHAAIARLRC
jgi:hypothetical protein